ncbi:hypothetical protein IE077_001604 [Cardiosporidium cionae]|uniref:Uncharacterized protein n=1 Tax=Cardiosporidium cionae TaxID=476202 RepID=A0ABQ7JCM6_9APIC|nr:hypothetical protein IE077_001604 [Cardiosporidium cionae]|eukprot:KAF8821772.1 hypothetical protein IE077_001604 [Cardiosporidium cionae]
MQKFINSPVQCVPALGYTNVSSSSKFTVVGSHGEKETLLWVPVNAEPIGEAVSPAGETAPWIVASSPPPPTFLPVSEIQGAPVMNTTSTGAISEDSSASLSSDAASPAVPTILEPAVLIDTPEGTPSGNGPATSTSRSTIAPLSSAPAADATQRPTVPVDAAIAGSPLPFGEIAGVDRYGKAVKGMYTAVSPSYWPQPSDEDGDTLVYAPVIPSTIEGSLQDYLAAKLQQSNVSKSEKIKNKSSEEISSTNKTRDADRIHPSQTLSTLRTRVGPKHSPCIDANARGYNGSFICCSIRDGVFFDPAVWDCARVPTLLDAVFIRHFVHFSYVEADVRLRALWLIDSVDPLYAGHSGTLRAGRFPNNGCTPPFLSSVPFSDMQALMQVFGLLATRDIGGASSTPSTLLPMEALCSLFVPATPLEQSDASFAMPHHAVIHIQGIDIPIPKSLAVAVASSSIPTPLLRENSHVETIDSEMRSEPNSSSLPLSPLTQEIVTKLQKSLLQRKMYLDRKNNKSVATMAEPKLKVENSSHASPSPLSPLSEPSITSSCVEDAESSACVASPSEEVKRREAEGMPPSATPSSSSSIRLSPSDNSSISFSNTSSIPSLSSPLSLEDHTFKEILENSLSRDVSLDEGMRKDLNVNGPVTLRVEKQAALLLFSNTSLQLDGDVRNDGTFYVGESSVTECLQSVTTEQGRSLCRLPSLEIRDGSIVAMQPMNIMWLQIGKTGEISTKSIMGLVYPIQNEVHSHFMEVLKRIGFPPYPVPPLAPQPTRLSITKPLESSDLILYIDIFDDDGFINCCDVFYEETTAMFIAEGTNLIFGRYDSPEKLFGDFSPISRSNSEQIIIQAAGITMEQTFVGVPPIVGPTESILTNVQAIPKKAGLNRDILYFQCRNSCVISNQSFKRVAPYQFVQVARNGPKEPLLVF